MSPTDEPRELEARLAALEALLARKNEDSDFLATILEALPSIVMRVDADLRILSISRVVQGFTVEQVVNTPLLQYMPDAARIQAEPVLRRAIDTGEPGKYQIEGDGPNGELSFYDCYVAATPLASGGRIAVIVAIDVSSSRLRERALEESRETLQIALDLTGLGIWSWDVDSGRTEWNEPMHRITGHVMALPPDAYVDSLVHPDDRDEVRALVARSLDEDSFLRPAHRILRPDGDVRWLMTSGRVLRDEHDRPRKLVGASLDVTAARRTEEHLQRTQRLEAVGQLAAGVAHNFNNMLATILPVLDLVREQVPEPYQPLVDDARHSGRRATELVRQLTTFAGRRETVRRTDAPAARIVGRAVDLCRHVLGRSATVSFIDRSSNAALVCDAGAIEQAIVNVVLNARDAIVDAGKSRGTITVEVASSAGPPVEVRIRISDDGAGMDDATRQRIFEPFFTTKEIGRGTGLGLAMTYATIREHGGTVHCESELGRGTTFEFVLPGTSRSERRSSPPAPIARRAAASTVLLIDDDVGVCSALTLLLEDYGHRILTAKDAESGISRARENPDIRLVMLDRSLPGGGGPAIVEALRAALPDGRIVYFSGDEVPESDARRVDGVLPKPASLAEIEALLDDQLRPSA